MTESKQWKEKLRDLRRRFDIEQEEDVGLYTAVACTPQANDDGAGAIRARLETELDCMCIVCPELKIFSERYLAEDAVNNTVWEWAFLGRKEDFDLFFGLAQEAARLVNQLPPKGAENLPAGYIDAHIIGDDFHSWLLLLFSLAWQCRTVSLLRAERTKINNPQPGFISVLTLDLFRASAIAIDMICKNK